MKHVPTKSIALRVNQIFWLPRRNVRKDYGDLNSTQQALVDAGGWHANYPVAAEEPTKAEIEEGTQAIQALIASVNEAISKKPQDTFLKAKAECLEYAYGKKIDLKSVGVTGNRRGACLFDAQAQLLIEARTDSPSFKVEELNWEVPTFQPIAGRYTDDEREEIQTFENATKDKGAKAMTDSELLNVTYTLVSKFGRNQSAIRSLFKATLGLRLYFACRVTLFQKILEWSGMTFMERLTAPKFKTTKDEENNVVSKEWLDFKAFTQEAFQGPKQTDHPMYKYGMGLMTGVDAKFNKANEERERSEKALLKRPKKTDIVSWINYWSGVGKASQPTMKRGEVQNFSGHHACAVVRSAMLAVDKNNVTHIADAEERAAGLNAVYLCKPQVYSHLDSGFALFKKLDMDTQVELAKRFSEDCVEAFDAAVASGAIIQKDDNEAVPEEEVEEAPAEKPKPKKKSKAKA